MARQDSAKRLAKSGPTRRTFLGGVGAGLGAAALSGAATSCGNGGSSSSDKVTLVRYGDAESSKIWKDMLKLFNEDHPDIEVDYRNIAASSWSEFFDTVSVQIAGGQVPDVVQVATEGQRLFASRNLVEPLDEYIDRDREELEPYFSSVHPNLMQWSKELVTQGDDATYYLPGGFNTMCIYYSTEAFAQAEVDEPADDWTWDDFLAISEQIKEKLDTFAMAVSSSYFAGSMPWLLTNGASTMNDDWTKATIATPEAVEAAEFMRLLVERGLSPKPGGEFDAFTAMTQGKVAMFGGGRWPLISLRNLDYVDRVKIAPWPQQTQQGSPVGWDAYPIMRESKNKEGAWELVKFMATREASERYAELSGTIVPPQEDIALSDSFLNNAPEGSEKLFEALSYATPIPSPDQGSVIEQDIIDTFTQILSGNAEAESALNDLNEKIESKL